MYGKATGNSSSGPTSWWGGVSGNHQGEANSDSQVDRDSHVVPACWLHGGSTQKRNNGLWQHLCPRGSHPTLPVLTLLSDTLVPPLMYLAPLELLPQHQNPEGVSPCKYIRGALKRRCLGLHKPLSHSATIPDDFYSQEL